MSQKKILIISDSIKRKTGYSTVAKNIIKKLQDRYEIAQLGLADIPTDVPFNIHYYSMLKNHDRCCKRGKLIEYYPRGSNVVQYLKLEKGIPFHDNQGLCRLGANDGNDNYGYISVYFVIQHFKPDIVLPINDVWGLYNLVHLRNRRCFKLMPYIAIDSACMFPQIDVPNPNIKLPPVNATQTIENSDYPVVFTNWAQDVLNKTARTMIGRDLKKMYTIPHGVDTSVWKPIEPEKRIELRKKFFNIENDKTFLIGCFLKDTPVLMGDLTYKPIQDIIKGDKVINHLGEIDEVVAPDPKEYSGDIHTILAGGLKDKITATSEHPFFAIENPKKGNLKRKNLDESLPISKKEWIPIKDLEIGDWIIEPINKETLDISSLNTTSLKIDTKFNKNPKKLPEEIAVDSDFMRFVGLFLAEGSFQYSWARGKKYKAGLYLNFNDSEKDTIKFCKDYYKKLFGNEPHERTQYRNSSGVGHVTLELNSKHLFEFMETLIENHHCQDKYLKNWFLKLPPNKQLELIKGFEEGDGCVDGNRIISVTTSKTLAEQLGKMMNRCAVSYSIREDGYCNRQNEKWSMKYRITRYTEKSQVHTMFNDDNFIYRKIIENNQGTFKGTVYNFEVKNKNSYVIQSVGVHNSVARNQPRKRLDALMPVLRTLIDKYEKKVGKTFKIYFHCSLEDKLGWPLPWLAQYYGVLDRCIFDKNLKPGEGPTEQELNDRVNCFDAHVVLANSEGWALPALETLAAGIPNIWPNYSAHADWGKDAIYLCKVAAIEHEPRTGFIKAIADTNDCAHKISLLASSKKFWTEWSNKGIKLGHKLDWANVTRLWETLIDSVDISDLTEDRYSDPFVSDPTVEDFSLQHFPKPEEEYVPSTPQL